MRMTLGQLREMINRETRNLLREDEGKCLTKCPVCGEDLKLFNSPQGKSMSYDRGDQSSKRAVALVDALFDARGEGNRKKALDAIEKAIKDGDVKEDLIKRLIDQYREDSLSLG